MPGIVALVSNLSLDVTRGLVLAGLGLGFNGQRYTNTETPAPLAIVDATNTSPIIVTTAQPHTIPYATTTNAMERQLHAVISGVAGNTAANNVDDTPTSGSGPRSTTSGQNLGTLCIATGPSTLALYAGYDQNSALVPLAGNGTYTSGGTIVPAFTRGRILIGREFLREATNSNAPPSCIFVPIGSRFGGKSTAMPSKGGGFPDYRTELSRRSLATDSYTMEVHAWGQASPPDPAFDFDRTQAIFQQVIASTHLLCSGCYTIVDGNWDDQREKATQMIKAGHWDVMRVAYDTPVTDAPLPFVPDDAIFTPTTWLLQPGNVSPTQGCG